MRVVARSSLRTFWERHPEAESALRVWLAEAEHGHWSSSADIKARYGNASILSGERVVFNICGNKYRLVVSISYPFGIVFIKFIGTHAEYDKIDARYVEWKRKF